MGKAEKRTKEEKDGNSGKSGTRKWIVEADPSKQIEQLRHSKTRKNMADRKKEKRKIL